MKYTLHRLREIYRKIGGEDSGRIYYEFFRAIDNNELDGNQALIKLVTELAERDLKHFQKSNDMKLKEIAEFIKIFDTPEFYKIVRPIQRIIDKN